MKAQKITEESIKEMKISSLPTRPTSPSSLGGRGYTSADMKAAFDRLPLYIVERFNLLMDDIRAVGEESLAAEIMTGFSVSHSLFDMFSDIRSGRFCEYLTVGEQNLITEICMLNEKISRLEEKIEQMMNPDKGRE